jgi:hypothetical protein
MIGNKVIIDSLTTILDDASTLVLSSAPITLVADQFVPITVKYYNVQGIAFISLQWKSTSQVQEIVQASQFFYYLDPTPISGKVL